MEPARFTCPAGTLLEGQTPHGESYYAFVPTPLPPSGEAEAVAGVAALLGDANHALGQLDGVGTLLPDPDVLARPYMRREAVLSSRIEGTHASFADLVAFESAEARLELGDARDVYNYVDAMALGLRYVEQGGIDEELVRRLHRRLMSGARGEHLALPGEFRTVQNHIGHSNSILDASFIPPPPREMQEGLADLFAYLAEPPPATPVLVQLAWAHYQFETLHPFQDGNGRVGRLLIPLQLAVRRRLSHPLLYLSPYFESRREEYYRRLFLVSADSDFGGWLRFFLTGVLTQAREGVSMARTILDLYQDWEERLNAARAPANAHRAAKLLQHHIALDARTVERELPVSAQTAYNQLNTLVRLGIAEELDSAHLGRRVYIAHELVALLSTD